MPTTTLFLGSSSAAKSQAKAVCKAWSSPTLEFLPWWTAFTAGRTLIDQLDGIRDRVQGPLLLFSPDATTRLRGRAQDIPNLNVLFELGYFYGQLGKPRVAMLKYGEFYLPSDLGGTVHIFGSSSFRRGRAVPVGKRASSEFQRWVSQL